MLFNLFKKKKQLQSQETNKKTVTPKRSQAEVATVKGEIGEHKIDIQLSQLPKEYKYINDLMLENPKSKSGYSQIDHVVITTHGIFVIETKNYQGTIYGGKDRKTWLVNGKFKFMNPFMQNYGHIESLKGLIDDRHKDLFISIVSFTKRCTFKVGLDLRKIGSNQLIVYDIELSEFLYRKVSIEKVHHKEDLLSEKEMEKIHRTFLAANITDPKLRQKHIDALNSKDNSSNIKQNSQKGTCEICKKVVSDKVRTYCLSNKKFQGKIYCFEHQKTI
jgi:hypothetical protein